MNVSAIPRFGPSSTLLFHLKTQLTCVFLQENFLTSLSDAGDLFSLMAPTCVSDNITDFELLLLKDVSLPLIAGTTSPLDLTSAQHST